MKAVLVLGLLPLLLLDRRGAAAADDTSWHGGGGVEEAYTDNVQQTSGPRRQGDWITTTTVYAGWEDLDRLPLPGAFSLWVQSHAYAHLSQFNYLEIRGQATYPLNWNTEALVSYLFSPHEVLYDDAGSAIAPAYREHQMAAGFRGRYGPHKRIRAQAYFRGEWDTYFETPGRDAWTPQFVSDLAYRFDEVLPGLLEVIPRVGFVYQDRQARNPNFSRHVYDVGPGLDVRFPSDITLRIRYDWVDRDYTVGTPKDGVVRNNNFDRKDRYHQVQTWLYFALPWEGLGLRPRFRFRRGYYDTPNRRNASGTLGVIEHFDVHEVGLELLYAF